MSQEIHAEHRRRLYLAMLEHPDGVTSKDFSSSPAIDGGEAIARVAPRILELRAEYDIPKGVTDHGGFAIYRLAGEKQQPEPEPGPTPIRVVRGHRLDAARVKWCSGCFANLPMRGRCDHGFRTEIHELGAGPRNQPCARAQVLANRQTPGTEIHRAA